MALPGAGAPPPEGSAPPSISSSTTSGRSDGASSWLAALIALFSTAGGLAYAGAGAAAIALFVVELALYGATIYACALAPAKGWMLVRGLVLVRLVGVPACALLARRRAAPRLALCVGLIIAGFVVAVTAGMCSRRFVVESFVVPSGSMIPSIEIGDHLFVRKVGAPAERGDLVVFRYPKDPTKDGVKRVVAVGGDSVEQRGDALIINGQPLAATPCDPPTLTYRDRENADSEWQSRTARCLVERLPSGRHYRVIHDLKGGMQPFVSEKVPPGGFFFVGDNRDNSHDSRYFGSVDGKFLVGVVAYRWWGGRGAGPVE